jgi:hypothetical protein
MHEVLAAAAAPVLDRLLEASRTKSVASDAETRHLTMCPREQSMTKAI